jgi:formylglycine-generating enzyme required for sulfatase activity
MDERRERTLTWAGAATAEEAPAVVGGRYEDLGLLAEGGMGEVRRVRDRLLDCIVARKSLGPDRVASPAARARFVAEATVTARLRHPGIVAVHDRGEDPDGALWYTMTEVRGDTLAARIAAERGTDDGLRRLVSVLVRVCDAVAFAHQEGVVHRDLKPDNVMVGPFGEVLVVDWGIAGRVGSDEEGAVGTPGWVAPEQARGSAPAPPADVYALGGLLHAVLTGGPPRTGPAASLWWAVITDPPLVAPGGPPVLAAWCARSMAPAPEERPTALALGEGLTRWLLDAERSAEARALVARAAAERGAIAALSERATALRSRAAAFLAALPPYADPDAKAPAWAWEDEAAGAERELAVRETAWLQQVGSALERDPELAEAHAALADHHAAALLRAEAERRPHDALRAEGFLRRHDRGRHAELLRGDGAVTLLSDPPGAEVVAHRVVERGRRLVAERVGVVGVTPLRDAPTERGSWLFELRHPDRAVSWVPVFLGRGDRWDGVAPGEVAPTPLRLPLPGELGPDERLVPPGWCWIGAPPDPTEPLPRQRVWVDGFVARRFPVTIGEYREFLADLARSDPDRAVALGPHGRQVDGRGPLTRLRDGAVELTFHEPRSDAHPITQITWHAAVAFAEWEARRTGLPWRLPDEVEWEKATRGVDGRRWVCGDHFEPSWFHVPEAAPTARALEPVGQRPVDTSVYGVCDLTGNAATWCANGWRDGRAADDAGRLSTPPPGDLRVVRGGSYSSGGPPAAARHADRPDAWFQNLGFRLVRSAAGQPID